MRTVVLIPYRPDGGRRDVLLEHVFNRWRDAGFKVYCGVEKDPSGPFNRSEAINEAARVAGDWDVAIIADADTIVPPHQATAAVDLAAETGRMVMAFTEFVPLSEKMSNQILDGFAGFWGKPKGFDWTCSSAVVVRRDLWDDVGGFDEGFRGWGMEDVAFALACDAVAGPRLRVDGPVWHLWHETSEQNNDQHPGLLANKERAQHYIDARDDLLGATPRARMLAVLRSLGVLPELVESSPAPADETAAVDAPDTLTVAWIESADRPALLAEIARLDLVTNPQAKIGTLRKVLIANLPG